MLDRQCWETAAPQTAAPHQPHPRSCVGWINEIKGPLGLDFRSKILASPTILSSSFCNYTYDLSPPLVISPLKLPYISIVAWYKLHWGRGLRRTQNRQRLRMHVALHEGQGHDLAGSLWDNPTWRSRVIIRITMIIN